MKKKVLCWMMVAVFLMFNQAMAIASASGGILKGQYSVLKNGKVVERLKGQNPLIEESLLVCNGKCVVELGGVNLIANNNAVFAVKDAGANINLLVKKGKVDFVLVNNSKKVSIYAPNGQYIVAQGIFSAAVGTSVKGFVKASADHSEIGVYEGKIVVDTAQGPKTLSANQKMMFAMSEVPGAEGNNDDSGAASEEVRSKRKGVYFWGASGKKLAIAGGVAAVGLGVGLGVGLSGDDDNDKEKTPASPSK